MLPKIIKGIPASKGVAKGTARVLFSLNELNKLQKGDILVTKATSPDWTPVINVVSAVITDLGGSLCHAAIVCREYGIPAVVGTSIATKVIKSGQEVEVDGGKGIIKVI